MKICNTRLVHILFRAVFMLVSGLSRLFNALVLNEIFGFENGSTHQTTSARMHIEEWPRGKRIINWIFWNQLYQIPGQEDHCEWAWQEELKEAYLTIKKATNS